MSDMGRGSFGTAANVFPHPFVATVGAAVDVVVAVAVVAAAASPLRKPLDPLLLPA